MGPETRFDGGVGTLKIAPTGHNGWHCQTPSKGIGHLGDHFAVTSPEGFEHGCAISVDWP